MLFDAQPLGARKAIVRSLVEVVISPATPGKRYRGKASAERIHIERLDPATGGVLAE